ncbi:MAG: hypothetical protein ABIP27_04565 [Flavobacterium circumlabens]|uniref:hypothetical protein n=1 Tax=Flavobacterium circumlabens TaxID=2133765 RepID=UPI003266FDC7
MKQHNRLLLVLLMLISICLYISLNPLKSGIIGIFDKNTKHEINREIFADSYAVKMNIDGSNPTFYVNVRAIGGKLYFTVNEGGATDFDYDETSAKEIIKNIEYRFEAIDTDSGNNRIYCFKKKGNRFELAFNY